MKLKVKLIIVVLSIVIYFFLNYIYIEMFKKDNMSEALILTNDVKRGELLNNDNIKKIKINGIKVENNVNTDNMVFFSDYPSGTILSSDMLVDNTSVIKDDENNEFISISIDSFEDNFAGDLRKGSKVNVYASAKINQLEKVINIENLESYTNSCDNGYATIKILSNQEVSQCYNSKENSQTDEKKIDVIVVKVDKKTAIKINNLKNYCNFSLSLV